MAEFGVTYTGFVIKRLQDILNDQRQKAVELFQDLIEPGDTVDTSDSSALGRLITLDASGDADLWELAQLVYSAFDPNSATGIALDNLVQYAGLTRFQPSPSTAIGLFVGDNGTLIASNSTVRASDTGTQFSVVSSVALSPSLAAGVILSVQTVTDSTAYTITYTPTGQSAVNVTYTSDASATESEILNGLQAIIASSYPLLSSSVVGSTLVVDNADVFQNITYSVTSNLLISKVKKTGDLQATENGELEQNANTITSIVTPVLGWDSVSNPLAASPGRLEETDEELRLRFRNSKFERATNSIDSIYSALVNVDGVTEVNIYENDTDAIDVNGVQPHSFLPIVVGGSSQQIAEAIWDNKPIGILSQGNISVSITDSQGFAHNISFSRPTPVVIYIDLDISENPESSTPLPADAVDLIKQAIIDYAMENFGVGDDVIYSRLYTPINTVPGHFVNSLFIGTSPSPVGTSNIVVDFDEMANFLEVNINVVVS